MGERGGEWEGRVRLGGTEKPRSYSRGAHAAQRRGAGKLRPCPAHRPRGWCPSAGRAACRSGQVRGAGTGLPEARQQPTLHPFFPALQAGVCRWQGRRRGAHDLGVRGEVAGQRGQGLGETEKRPLAPLYMGGSLQRTISRSLR